MSNPLRIRTVFHPSDFSVGDQPAMAHALRIALQAKAELHLLHVDHDDELSDWSDFPSVRQTLADWKLVPPGAGRDEIRALGLGIEKILRRGPDVHEAIQDYVADKEPDLVVLATHQRTGVQRWLHRALAEPIARQSHAPTLFVPRRVLGFVRPDSGRVTLSRVLVPVDRTPSPQIAIEAACSLVDILGVQEAHFVLLHAGQEEDMPAVRFPGRDGWTHEERAWPGPVVDHILDAAEAGDSDLIVMAKRGHRGFLDGLRGSHTERVLRGARCPVLIVPER